MSWFNQVKFIYTSTITLLMTFLWTVVLATFFGDSITFQLFFIILVISNIGIVFLRKGIDAKLCLFIAIVPIALFQLLTSKEVFLAVLDIGFSALLLTKLLGEEKNDVNYDEYKRGFTKGLFGIFTVGFIYNMSRWLRGDAIGREIYIGIIVYIILAVISLREATAYEYQIKRTKVSKYINYGLVTFGILITQPFIYNGVMSVIQGIVNGAIDILLFILKYPLLWLSSLINIPEVKIPVNREEMEALTPGIGNINEGNGGALIVYLFMGILFLIFLYILYRAMKKISYKINRNKNQEYTEVIETIEVEQGNENKLFDKFKKILRKKGTPREEVIYRYGELVHVAKKKEIFKPFMTPKQLRNLIKIKVKASADIDYVTDTYNEAKFSTHDIEKTQEKLVEEKVNKLNKEIM